MPTYEYECKNCGHSFDKLQSMSDSALQKCPKCRKNKLRRLIGAGAGVIFKGSGFYATDYRKPDKKKAKGEEEKKLCSSCDSASSCPNAQK